MGWSEIWSDKYPPRRESRLGNIAVMGPSGSGKNHLLEKLELPDGVRIVHVGDEIAKYLSQLAPRYGQAYASKDTLKMSGDIFTVVEGLVTVLNAHIEGALANHETLIFNAQMVHWHNDVGYDGKGGWTDESWTYQRKVIQSPAAYIHIEADPEQILEWRNKDKRIRRRREETPEEIANQQRLSCEYTERTARLTGARFVRIENRGDNVEENVARIRHEAIKLFI